MVTDAALSQHGVIQYRNITIERDFAQKVLSCVVMCCHVKSCEIRNCIFEPMSDSVNSLNSEKIGAILSSGPLVNAIPPPPSPSPLLFRVWTLNLSPLVCLFDFALLVSGYKVNEFGSRLLDEYESEISPFHFSPFSFLSSFLFSPFLSSFHIL